MKLRPTIEPDLGTAERLYPEVLKAILDYTEFSDAHGDDDMAEYKNLEATLHKITGKDMSKFNLSEWWEEEGAEPLAFKISLPDPFAVPDLVREEVQEIVRRLKNFEEPEQNNGSFLSMFHYYLDSYYHAFLQLNCSRYNAKLFQRIKDKSGNYSEFTVEEIVDRII